MAAKSTDILMRVVRNGKPVEAEGQTSFPAKVDSLREGFVSGKCFDVMDFSFSIGSEAGRTKKFSREAAEEYREKFGVPPPEPATGASPDNTVIDAQPIAFTRQMDCASPTLFTAMVGVETLDTISIIKRKGAGSAASGEIYLRLDFYKVLLIGLDWDDEDTIVEEKWKFICRTVNMRFRPQKPDGTLGAIVTGSWTMNA
jgi:type VI protein secretion system component Hcp